MKSFDTFRKEIEIGDIVVIGSHQLDSIITYSGEFYECRVKNIEPIPHGPFGDILYLKKPKYGRNCENQVILNRDGNFRANDLEAVENEYEDIQMFSTGVIKV